MSIICKAGENDIAVVTAVFGRILDEEEAGRARALYRTLGCKEAGIVPRVFKGIGQMGPVRLEKKPDERKLPARPDNEQLSLFLGIKCYILLSTLARAYGKDNRFFLIMRFA